MQRRIGSAEASPGASWLESRYRVPTFRVFAHRGFNNRVAHISCYTDQMGHAKQNVTLVVEEELLLAARKVALDQRTSVNQLVRDYLAMLVEEPSRRRLARARLKTAFETGIVEVGDRKWSREDLYDR